jgi:hypothetical protein
MGFIAQYGLGSYHSLGFDGNLQTYKDSQWAIYPKLDV